MEAQFGELPICLLGYSFGAYLAFDVARTLEVVHHRKPSHLLLLGAPSRQVQQRSRLFQSDYNIDDETEFERRRVAHDSGFGELPKAFRDIADNVAVRAALVPVFIEDTKSMRQWCVDHESNDNDNAAIEVNCDFTFMTGKKDVEVQRSFRDWQAVIGGVPQAVYFPGGHYFVFEFDERNDDGIAEECGRILCRSLEQ